jgi:aldehyde dehydrogenase (NAD+)
LTHKTRSAKFRIAQLRNLKKGIQELAKDIDDALKTDLGREGYTNVLFETGGIEKKIDHAIENLHQWMQPDKKDTPIVLGPGRSRVVYEPLGVALIMGSWNFPFFTTIGPVIYAIAAGCCFIAKPSELAPQSSKIIKRLIVRYLDSSCYSCIEGAVKVAIAITSKPFDVILFTGSTEKGKLVAAAAAKNLVPCILELGGKSPTIIDESADLDFAAKKVVWGRYANCGQICVAPDYVLCHNKHIGKFNDLLKKYIKEFWDEGRNIKDGGHLISDFHKDRLCGLMKDHGGQVIAGNASAHEDKCLSATVVLNPDQESPLMKEEIFGPILPVFGFGSIDEAITHVNKNDKPLVLYYFGSVLSNKNKDRVENETSSGGMVVNDVLVHLLNPDLPFGGVGYSGYGKYHGEDGFKCFSNPKAVLVKPAIPADFLYPPYNASKVALIKRLMSLLVGSQCQFFKKIVKILIGLWIIKLIVTGRLTPTTVKKAWETVKMIFNMILILAKKE